MTQNTMVTIQLNGRPHTLPADGSVADLLQQLGAKRPLAVEVNEQVVPRTLHAQTRLQQGDRVELVTLVGGG